MCDKFTGGRGHGSCRSLLARFSNFSWVPGFSSGGFMSNTRLLLLCTLLFSGLSAFAQDAPQTPTPSAPATRPRRDHPPADMAERRLKAMTRRLALTSDQQEKIRPILEDEAKQVQSIDADSSLTEQQKRRKTRDVRMTSRSKIQPILTPEQQAKMPAGRGGRGHGHRASNAPVSATPDSSGPQ
jgi:periplasmic protein CpxP/Spy